MPTCQKHFIAMQIILAIHTLHQLKLYHGYVRTSNILLNSSDHVVLSDMATYKPYYLRENELGEFTAIY
jgi:phosphoinositide-3-kinase regulatory subunit 4